MLIIIQNLGSLLHLWDSVVETHMLHLVEPAGEPVPQKFNVLVEWTGEPVYILKKNPRHNLGTKNIKNNVVLIN